MKTYRGVDVQIHIFLISALVASECSALYPGRFIPGERAPGTHWVGGWVGPSTGLNDVVKIKFLTLLDSNSDPLVVQSVASRCTDYVIPALQPKQISTKFYRNL
jgi:hypothetical protein